MPSLSQAYEECHLLNRHYGTPFGEALPLFPKQTQPHLHAVFAYDRIAREFLYRPNKGITEEQQLHALQNWKEAFLQSIQDAYSPNHYLQALLHTKQVFDLPEKAFIALIELRKQRFLQGQFKKESEAKKHEQTFVKKYLDVLQPILRNTNRQEKKAIGIFIQNAELLESFQWLKKSEKRHLGLSKEHLKRFGYTSTALVNHECNQEWKQLIDAKLIEMETQLAWIQKQLSGFSESLQLPFASLTEWQGEYIDAIRKKDYDLFSRQPRLGFSNKLKRAIPRLQSLLR